MPGPYSYQETIDYLYGLQKHGIKLGMKNSHELMRVMGDPHRVFPSVHVAGTNGKGSTCAFIAGVLQEAGFRVGLYTSPHLVSFTERMRINGTMITEAQVVSLADRVREQYQKAGQGTPTFFEVTTAIAFTWFAEEKVDIAVIETGMGGRLDSTNVIHPLVSVITNIDLEHTEFLGDTISMIAAEKAGIIKQGAPVVSGVIQPEAAAVMEREATSNNAALIRIGREFRADKIVTASGSIFDYHGLRRSLPDIRIRMAGRHQVYNACLALAALELLDETGFRISGEAFRSGLERISWEGRLEQVAKQPDIYLDGAHNPASASVLASAVRDLKLGYRRLVLVIGILGDKDYQAIVSSLAPLADKVIATKPDYSRAMDPAKLAEVVRDVHPAIEVESVQTVSEAIDCARKSAGPEDFILITGSLYVVGDAKSVLASGSNFSAFQGLKG